ncbi:hypothetical protein HN873_028793 [Arachis hypogaea]|nr:uncharacterized protein DS421_9g264740 [Arachis hypogaea]
MALFSFSSLCLTIFVIYSSLIYLYLLNHVSHQLHQSLLLLAKPFSTQFFYIKMTMLALLETFTLMNPSLRQPRASPRSARPDARPHGSARLPHFLHRSHMKPQVVGLLHLMDHMLGGCASRKKLVLKVIIVIPPTKNGPVILERVTTAEDQFNFPGITTMGQQGRPWDSMVLRTQTLCQTIQ